jgi:hypothetical protein
MPLRRMDLPSPAARWARRSPRVLAKKLQPDRSSVTLLVSARNGMQA